MLGVEPFSPQKWKKKVPKKNYTKKAKVEKRSSPYNGKIEIL